MWLAQHEQRKQSGLMNQYLLNEKYFANLKWKEDFPIESRCSKHNET